MPAALSYAAGESATPLPGDINPAYRARELGFVLNQSGAKLLIAAQRLKTSDYTAMIAEVQLDTDDPINIQYTSGTTGFPKGASGPSDPEIRVTQKEERHAGRDLLLRRFRLPRQPRTADHGGQADLFQLRPHER
jgi:non-ribosomal peptide synthetase component F